MFFSVRGFLMAHPGHEGGTGVGESLQRPQRWQARGARCETCGAQRGAYGEHQWISIVSIVSLQ